MSTSTGVSYGAYGILRLFRAKNTLDGFLKPKPDATGDAPSSVQHELEIALVGKPSFTPQGDGTLEMSFPHAEHRPAVIAFEDNYREEESASGGSKSAYDTATGKSYGGDADISNVDAIFYTYAGGIDPDSGEVMVYAGFGKVLAATGGHSLDPNTPTERALIIRGLKPKADTVFHKGDQSFTTLDTAAVAVSSEASDISVLNDDPKGQFFMAKASN